LSTICPTHLTHPSFIIIIMPDERYTLWSVSVCNILRPSATSSQLCPNILLSTLFPNTLKLCLSFTAKDRTFYPYKKTPWPESASELYRPTDRRLSANSQLLRIEGPRGQRDGSLWQYSRISRPEPLFFLSSSSSIVLRRLSGPRSRPTTSQKIL
jgi:hypothetical protein